MYGYPYYTAMPWDFLHPVFTTIFVIFIIFLIVRVFKGPRHQEIKDTIKDIKNSIAESPMDILKKRYAKGEITKREFDEMKKDLS